MVATQHENYREPADGYDCAPPVRAQVDPVRLHQAEIQRAVEVASAGYLSKLWWMSKREIEQQAWLFALEIMRQGTYDPDVGVPLFSYLKTGISRLLWTYVLAESAPVSASRRKAGILKGITRADLEEAPEGVADLHTDYRSAMQTAWRRSRIESLLTQAVGEQTTERALPYLLREERDYERAARRAGVTVDEVKKAVAQVRRTIVSSREMWALWAEA